MTQSNEWTWCTRRLGMFRGKPQFENFSELSSILPVRVVRRSSSPRPLSRAAVRTLPASYVFNGEDRNTEDFIRETETAGLIVLRNGAIEHEAYYDGANETLQWPSWSINKSITSCLVGIAIEEGLISSLSDAVSDYVPDLVGSGYDGVSLHDVLAMISGVRWNENYADPDSDIARNAAVMAGIGSRDKLAIDSEREHTPGTRHRYNSSDTQVLGMVLRAVTGVPMVALLHQKIWEPLGMEDDAFWIVDSSGIEWSAGGLQATLRDFAKFGLLYANGGRAHGKQIVSEKWVKQSTRPAEVFLMPGPKAVSPGNFGYGYQWWLAPDGSGAFAGIGVHNQYLYVDPARDVVIVKGSSNRNFAATYDEAGYRDEEHMAMFAAIAAAT